MTDSTDNSAEAAELILEIERAIMAAIKSKDAAALEPMLADEFVYRRSEERRVGKECRL